MSISKDTILDADLKHQRIVLRHISNVRETCILLAEKLAEEEGKKKLARHLIMNGLMHDSSKLSGIEWEYLREDMKKNGGAELFEVALNHHRTTQKHHPEFWLGIHNMPEVYLAEWVADIKARSSEFATDLRSWIKDVATKKHNFTVQSRVYKRIKYYLDLLLDDQFS